MKLCSFVVKQEKRPPKKKKFCTNELLKSIASTGGKNGSKVTEGHYFSQKIQSKAGRAPNAFGVI